MTSESSEGLSTEAKWGLSRLFLLFSSVCILLAFPRIGQSGTGGLLLWVFAAAGIVLSFTFRVIR